MSDEFHGYDDDEDDEPQGVRLDPKDLKALRQKARQAEKYERELATYRRTDAFKSVGLDPSNRQIQYFMKAYDGELDPEKIREEAVAAGFIKEAEKPVPKGAETTSRIVDASTGAGEVMEPDLAERIANAKSSEEVMAIITQAGLPTTWNRSFEM